MPKPLLNRSGINHDWRVVPTFRLLCTKECTQNFTFFAYLSMLMATRLNMDEVLQMTSSDMWKSQRILGNLQRPQLTCKKSNMCETAKRFYFFHLGPTIGGKWRKIPQQIRTERKCVRLKRSFIESTRGEVSVDTQYFLQWLKIECFCSHRLWLHSWQLSGEVSCIFWTSYLAVLYKNLILPCT